MQQLEAEHKLLKIETEALAALQKSQEETHHEMVTSSDFTELCLMPKIRHTEGTIPKGDQILITRIQELEDCETVQSHTTQLLLIIYLSLITFTAYRCDMLHFVLVTVFESVF